MGAARPRALSGRGRTLGIGERSRQPTRTGDDRDHTRVGRGPTLILGYEVGCRPWLADTPGNGVPAPGTGGSIIRNELKITPRASRHFGRSVHPAFAAAEALTGRKETAQALLVEIAVCRLAYPTRTPRRDASPAYGRITTRRISTDGFGA